jgi:hypothetical protein
MKIFEYDHQTSDGGSKTLSITEYQILDEYWDAWTAAMTKKYGPDSQLIVRDKCIEDWVAVNSAWLKSDTSYK